MTHTEATNRAHEFMRENNYEIIDRNLRVSRTDGRKAGVHLVVWDSGRDQIAFVIVTRTKSRLAGTPLALLCDRAKVRRAINNWRRVNRWRGAWRVDAVCICGDGEKPIVDHVMNVKL